MLDFDLENCTEAELTESFKLLVAQLSRTQQAELLEILVDIMGISPLQVDGSADRLTLPVVTQF